LDLVHVRFLHLPQELPGVGGERLDVPTLPLGVERVEGERRLPGSRDAGQDHQAVSGDVEVEVLEVVLARAAHADLVQFALRRIRGIVGPRGRLRVYITGSGLAIRYSYRRASTGSSCAAFAAGYIPKKSPIEVAEKNPRAIPQGGIANKRGVATSTSHPARSP